MVAIKIDGITKKYKNTVAVDNLSLEINEGELFSLLGVNGAGKTTTIKILSCVSKPDTGDACVFGNSVINSSDKVKALIGVSPQNSAIAPNLTVEENLRFIAGLFGFVKAEIDEKVNKYAELLSIKDVLGKKAGVLSGGYQRRLSIALALISEPKVLFLDEPTLGLDVLARGDLWDIIKSLKGKTTIILTTHYMNEAESLSDRVGVMKNGRLIACGSTEDIKTIAQTDSFESAFIKLVKENWLWGCLNFP